MGANTIIDIYCVHCVTKNIVGNKYTYDNKMKIELADKFYNILPDETLSMFSKSYRHNDAELMKQSILLISS